MDELRKNGVDVDVQILSSHINYVLARHGQLYDEMAERLDSDGLLNVFGEMNVNNFGRAMAYLTLSYMMDIPEDVKREAVCFKISCIRTLFNRIDTHCNTSNLSKRNASICTLLFTKMTVPDILSTKYCHAKNRQSWNSPRKQRQESLYPTHTALEMASRLLRPFNIDVAHKPTNKLIGLILPNTRTKELQQTNTTPFTCSVVQIAQKNTLDKHLKRYKQD